MRKLRSCFICLLSLVLLINYIPADAIILAQSDPDKEIKEFPGFDMAGFDPYFELAISSAQKEQVNELLPNDIEVVLTDGSKEKIPASWECDVDILKTEYKLYTYNLVLPEGYRLSAELQEKCDSFEIGLPFTDVKIEDDQYFIGAKSNYPLKDIENTWKTLSDEKLREYFDGNNAQNIYFFLNTLSEDDLNILLKRDTPLADEVKVSDREDHYITMTYYEYIISHKDDYDLDAARETYFTNNGSTKNGTGYCYYTFKDGRYYVKYRVDFTIKKDATTGYQADCSTAPTFTIASRISSTGGTAPATGIFTDAVFTVNNSGKMSRSWTTNTTYAYSTTNSNYRVNYNGTTRYMTAVWQVFRIKITGVKKPAYTYVNSYEENTVGDTRWNFAQFFWSATYDNLGKVACDHEEYLQGKILFNRAVTCNTFYVQQNMRTTGLGTTQNGPDYGFGTHSTMTIPFKHPTLTTYFNPNGGTGSTASESGSYNDVWNSSRGLPTPASLGFTKTGYHYTTGSEWFSGATEYAAGDVSITCDDIFPIEGASDGVTVNSSLANSSSNTKPSRSKTLYVNWTPNTYRVYYDSNKPSSAAGSVMGSTAMSSHVYDQAQDLSTNGYYLNGWEFAGWNTSPSGTGTSYYNREQVINLSSVDNDIVILYAQWNYVGDPDPTYTVKYYANEPEQAGNAGNHVTGSMSNSYHTYGVSQRLNTNNYALSGWTFKGWNTKADGSGKSYSDREYVLNLTDVDGATVSLYAQWEPNPYTVKYLPNAPAGLTAEGNTPDSNGKSDYPHTLSKNEYSVPGYRFLGWAESANGPVKYTDEETITRRATVSGEEIKLYAVWEEIPAGQEPVIVNYLKGDKDATGEEKSETIEAGVDEYVIKANTSDFTNFALEDGTFIGWDYSDNNRTGAAQYTKGELPYRETLGEILKHSEYRIQTAAAVKPSILNFFGTTAYAADDEMLEVDIKAVWDYAPSILPADGSDADTFEVSYYEGETVTKDDLIGLVKATDNEDDDAELTEKIVIKEIKYAPGKITGGVKDEAGYTESWSDDMPDDAFLDTWFMQMEKDAQVTHTIKYEVTDSAGNTTEYTCKVNVKYNNAPVFKDVTLYYSLEEAKGGAINRQEVFEKVRAWDKEDCADHSGDDSCLKADTICDFTKERAVLAGFDAEVFKSYGKPGYEVYELKAVDQYGKEGKGKLRIVILMDGETGETTAQVRFIDKENFEKNKAVTDGIENPSMEIYAEMNEKPENKKGGLIVGSIWYVNEEYRNLAEGILDENVTPIEEYTKVFTQKDIQKKKEELNN